MKLSKSYSGIELYDVFTQEDPSQRIRKSEFLALQTWTCRILAYLLSHITMKSDTTKES